MSRRVPNDPWEAAESPWVWPLSRWERFRSVFGYKRCEICCNGDHTTAQCWVRYFTERKR